MKRQHADPDGAAIDGRLLRLVLPLDAVALGALVVVVLAAVPALALWDASGLIRVVGPARSRGHRLTP